MNNIQELFEHAVLNQQTNIGKLKKDFNSSKIRVASIDDFFSISLSKHLEEVFPIPSIKSDLKSKRYQIGKHIVSRDSGNLDLLHDSLKTMLSCFKSEIFVKFIAEVTDSPDLLPDYDDWGAGVQQTIRGGYLKKHIDSPYKDSARNLFRRINTIFYLNSNWNDSYNGNLEIWDDDKKLEPLFSIKPVINRLIIFETSSFSWHGHTKPLQCPEGMTRKSIAQFYYSQDNGMQNKIQEDPLWSIQ